MLQAHVPNIPHKFGLSALKESLDKEADKTLSTDTIQDLAELVLICFLKNNRNAFLQKTGHGYC